MGDETVLRLEDGNVVALKFADRNEGECCVVVLLYTEDGTLQDTQYLTFDPEDCEYDVITDAIPDALDAVGCGTDDYEDLEVEWAEFQDFGIEE